VPGRSEPWATHAGIHQTTCAAPACVLDRKTDEQRRRHLFDGQIEAFVAGILDGAAVLPDLNDAIKTQEVVLAADRAASGGKTVKLPL
jgi:predicted dehydrogenase